MRSTAAEYAAALSLCKCRHELSPERLSHIVRGIILSRPVSTAVLAVISARRAIAPCIGYEKQMLLEYLACLFLENMLNAHASERMVESDVP